VKKLFLKWYFKSSNYPDIRQIIKDSPLILVNADEFVDFPRPLFSNIIYIGGLGMEEGKNTKINKIEVFIWGPSKTSILFIVSPYPFR